MVELTGGKHIFASPIICGMTCEEMLEQELEEEMDKSKAIILLKSVDDNRFGALTKRLREATYLDRDEYPTSVTTMYELMIKTIGNIQQSSLNNNSRNRRSVINLLQQGNASDSKMVPGSDSQVFDIICYNCNRHGHYASCCPEATNRAGNSNLQCGHIMTQAEIKHGLIPPDWVLLDSCSTENAIHDSTLITNSRRYEPHEEILGK